MKRRLLVLIVVALLISACGNGGKATHTPRPTLTTRATVTLEKTATHVPPTETSAPEPTPGITHTPCPSATPFDQAHGTPERTVTPVPPTATPAAEPEPTPDSAHAPRSPDDWWRASTPEEQGLDPQIVARAYQRAAGIRTIYSLLVVKNGYLVAEEYFNGQSVHSANATASVTKSFMSALIGIALENGLFTSLDQKMLDFFPEYDVPNLDRRKGEITLRHLLQMRAGYPFDSTEDFFDKLLRSGNWMRFIVRDYALVSAPGQRHDYSNASAHLLSGILTRAAGVPTLIFANQYLFEPLGITVRAWPKDPQGYYAGHGDLGLRPRDMAKFGYLYLNEGRLDAVRPGSQRAVRPGSQRAVRPGSQHAVQIVPAEWVTASFQAYSVSPYGSLGYFRNIRYGYLWWIADVGPYQVYFAWGHGGQYIVLVPELDLIVVSSADAFIGDFSDESWEMEGGIMDLIGEFVSSIDNG
jgi:CubicO group peptidase (beta-lactamase class C family)